MNREIDILKLYNAKSIKPETAEEIEEFYKEDVGYWIDSAVKSIVSNKLDMFSVKNISIIDFNRILGIKYCDMYKVLDNHYFAFINLKSNEEKIVVVTYDILGDGPTDVDITIGLSYRLLRRAIDNYGIDSSIVKNILIPFIGRGLTLDETRICLEAVGKGIEFNDIDSAIWMRALHYLSNRECYKES